MARNPKETERRARAAEEWLDNFAPAALGTYEADASDLRAISAAKAALDATVSAALAKGRGWSPIAAMLDGTRSDAQARFGDLTPQAKVEQDRRLTEWIAAHSSGEDVPGDAEQAEDAMAWVEANSADLYVHVGWSEQQRIVRTEDLGRGVSIDYDEHDGVVGIEVLDAARLTVEGVTRSLSRGRKDPSP